MIRNKYFIQLTKEQIEFFKLFSEVVVFRSPTQIIYSGQIPMAAYLLLEGSITLRDAQNRKLKNCDQGVLLGFTEIYNNTPYKYTAEIHQNSKVLILDRSTILEINTSFQKRPQLNIIDLKELTQIA